MPKGFRWITLPQLDHRGPPDRELLTERGILWRLHWDGARGVPWNVQRRVGTAWHHFSAHCTFADARHELLVAWREER